MEYGMERPSAALVNANDLTSGVLSATVPRALSSRALSRVVSDTLTPTFVVREAAGTQADRISMKPRRTSPTRAIILIPLIPSFTVRVPGCVGVAITGDFSLGVRYRLHQLSPSAHVPSTAGER